MNGLAGGIVHRLHSSFWILLSKLLIFVLELVFSRSRVDESNAKDEALGDDDDDDDENEEERSVFNKHDFFDGNGASGFLQVESFTVQELREEEGGFVLEKGSGDEANRGSRILSTGVGPETEDEKATVATEIDLEEDDRLNFIVEEKANGGGGDEDTVSAETKESDLNKEEDLDFIVETRELELADDVSVSVDSERNCSDDETEKTDSQLFNFTVEPEGKTDLMGIVTGDDDPDDEFIEMQPQKKLNSEQIPMWVSDEEDDFDSDSDSDDIIEQLRMEIRNARSGGLATILEESESPKMVEEFKPLVLEEKVADINKLVFKTYEERMKKLDILNCQTMHAIDLLHLKGPYQSDTTKKKSSDVAVKSFWPFRQREADDATANTGSIRDLNKDLETVYVGQICLSWEILNWQYDKALKLLESDHRRSKQYNQVAGEFQLFQVLLQRFLEDEPFQNVSRVRNYVKNRFVFRKFLQVPSLRDDHSKDRNGNRYPEERSAISIEELAEIMEESMQMFWGFLRADKDECNISSKTPQIKQVAPQGSERLMGIRTGFQKKERELREIVRSSSCILKKFQKQQPRSLLNHHHHAYLVAQAELKLVSRVLNKSKISSADQMVWCQEKLEKLKFCSRKIEIEPSCLLFPC